MAEILGAATSATKFFLEVNQISIDNWTFKLFYKATTTLLLACSVIASSKQFFGDPINCEVVRIFSISRFYAKVFLLRTVLKYFGGDVQLQLLLSHKGNRKKYCLICYTVSLTVLHYRPLFLLNFCSNVIKLSMTIYIYSDRNRNT